MAAPISRSMPSGMGSSGIERSGRSDQQKVVLDRSGEGSEITVGITQTGDAICGPPGHAVRKTTRDPLKSHCPHCGEQFGHAWQGVGLKAHLWKVHGVPGEATFNEKVIKFPREGSEQLKELPLLLLGYCLQPQQPSPMWTKQTCSKSWDT